MSNKTHRVNELAYLLDGYKDPCLAWYVGIKNDFFEGKTFQLSQEVEIKISDFWQWAHNNHYIELFSYENMRSLRAFKTGLMPVFKDDIWKITLFGSDEIIEQVAHVYNFSQIFKDQFMKIKSIRLQLLDVGNFRLKSEEKSKILNSKQYMQEKYQDLQEYLRYRSVRQKISILHQLDLADVIKNNTKQLERNQIDEYLNLHFSYPFPLKTQNVLEVEKLVENIISRKPISFNSIKEEVRKIEMTMSSE